MKDGYIARNPVTGTLDKVKTNPAGDESKIDRRVSKMDTEVGFLAVLDLKGKWISVVANYSMHYVGDWPNGTITADYFGVFSNQLKKELGAGNDFVCMMTNGTSGEANIWDFLAPDRYPKEPFEKNKLIGKDIAGKVAAVMNTLAWDEDPVLQAHYRDVTVGVRKPSAEEVETAKEIVAKADFENIKTIDEDSLRKIYAREQVFLNEYPDSINFPVQLLRIGPVRIGALAGEFFAETGLNLKKESATNYFTITMANGYVGYVPPAHEIELGGYETWRCRTSHLEPGAEALIRKELTTFVKQ